MPHSKNFVSLFEVESREESYTEGNNRTGREQPCAQSPFWDSEDQGAYSIAASIIYHHDRPRVEGEMGRWGDVWGNRAFQAAACGPDRKASSTTPCQPPGLDGGHTKLAIPPAAGAITFEPAALMTDTLWQASKPAKPLSLGFNGAYGAPSKDIESLAITINRFLYTFDNLEVISKRQNTLVERLPSFVQTLDECRDFVYDYEDQKKKSKKFGKRELVSESVKLSYKLPRYVYTDEDIQKFEERLRFHLYAMEATLDDIMLRAFIKVTKSEIASTGNHRTPQRLDQPLTVQKQGELGNDVRLLYTEIERLENTLKRMGPQALPNLIDEKTPRKPDDSEIMKLREALKSSIRDHRLQDDELPEFLARSIQFQDDDSLLRYSGEKLKRVAAALNKHSSMIIRKRVFGFDEDRSVTPRSFDPTVIATNIRIPRNRTEDIFHRLRSIDVVNCFAEDRTRRFVVCTDDSGKIGIVHHLPPTIIYPFTKHEKITKNNARGLLFGKNEVSLVELSAVEIVGLEHERESLPEASPRYSFQDTSDMLGFEDALRQKHILHTLNVDTIKSNRGSEARAQHLKIWSAIDDGQISLSFYSHEIEPKSHFEFRSNTPESEESAVSTQSIDSSIFTQVHATIGKMGHLEIDFTTTEHRTDFMDELRKVLSRQSSTPESHLDLEEGPLTPEEKPSTPEDRWSMYIPPPLPPPPSLPPPPPPPAIDHSLVMFRVQGIPYSCLNGGTRPLIRQVLGLPEDTDITTRSLAVSPDPNKLTAVVYFKEIPEKLSSKTFLQTQELKVPIPTPIADDNKESVETLEWITFDTHFRNLTILWSVNPDAGYDHTLDICAVSGLGAHAWGSFRERGGPFMWLVDSLPREFRGARIMTYGFETKLKNNTSTQNLKDLAKYLLSDLENLRKSPPRVPLVFIAHSLGGLVVKQAMISARREKNHDFVNSIKGALFFGVPSEGMDIRSLRPIVEGQPNEALLMALEIGSSDLQAQNEVYCTFFDDYLEPPVAFFYENKLSKTAREVEKGKWKLDGPLTHLVSASSATCGFCMQPRGRICQSLEKDHSELVKFNGPDDGEYKHVLPILTKIISRT
ncbi:hypothetical protein B7463_g1659, partial [Scytalidium lignicola]